MHKATNVDPIDITSMQITKSVNSEHGKDKVLDTMGMKHRVDFAVYVCWWDHHSKPGQYSSAKVHRLLEVKRNIDEQKTINDYTVLVHELDGLKVEIIKGM
ncbi:hypothetical protein BK734_33595 [Bacillus thuringiensis serovar kim]|nr:hypothetical protein BK734_33595 [Bacillus thuringiensis serovar kim]